MPLAGLRELGPGCLASGLTPQPRGPAMTSGPGRKQQSLLRLYLHGRERRDEGVTPVICNVLWNFCVAQVILNNILATCQAAQKRNLYTTLIYIEQVQKDFGEQYFAFIRQYVVLYIVPLLQVSQPLSCTKKASESFSPPGLQTLHYTIYSYSGCNKGVRTAFGIAAPVFTYSIAALLQPTPFHLHALPAINIYRAVR